MHTPSLQLQPSEAATGLIVQLRRICLHLQKQMGLDAGSFAAASCVSFAPVVLYAAVATSVGLVPLC